MDNKIEILKKLKIQPACYPEMPQSELYTKEVVLLLCDDE